MKRNRIISLILAGLMSVSSVSILASCVGKKNEPEKQKRTNVYSGEEVKIPSGIDNIIKIFAYENKVYLIYNKGYTITYNENGEEVSRKEGYYWEGDNEETAPIVPRLVGETETAATVEENPDTDGESLTETSEDEQLPDKLPDGWWTSYTSVQQIGAFDIESKNFSEVPFNIDREEDGYPNYYTVDRNGNLVLILSKWTYNEDYTESTNTYKIASINPSTGSVESNVDITDVFKNIGVDMMNFYVNGFCIASDGMYYITDGSSVYILDSSAAYKGKIDVLDGGGWIMSMIPYSDKVLVSYSNASGNSNAVIIENGQKTDVTSEVLKEVLTNGYNFNGSSENKIYYTTSVGINEYDFETDTAKEILNYMNSDIDRYSAANIVVLPDGRVVVAQSDYSGSKVNITFSIMSKVPDEQLEEEVIVKVASTYQNYQFTKAAIRFNKKNTGVRISTVDYSSYNNEDNEYTGALKQLNNDIITGNVADILILDSSQPIESYFHKGYFTDLNKYIDDPEKGLNRVDYLDNIFRASEIDGKMYSLITAFSVCTLAAKSEFVGTEPGWTFEEMMNCIKNAPEGCVAFFDYGRNSIMQTLFNYSMDSFLDWEKGTTLFNTQGFIDFIKYLSTCPEKGYWEAYYDNYDYSNYDEDQERAMDEKYQLRFYKNYALFEFEYCYSINSFLNAITNFATEDITFIGFPTKDENSNGAVISPSMELAISANSKVKDQAWEVLKFMLTDEQGLDNSYQFSASRAAMKKLVENAKDDYWGGNAVSDEQIEWYKSQKYSDEYIEYLKNSRPAFDEKYTQKMMDIIEGANTVSRTDSALYEIISDELSGFFAGSKSAEETAKVIDSRVSIYISENS